MRAAFYKTLSEIMARDKRVTFIGSDLSPALAAKEKDFPGRWLMEGVMEQGLVGFASGKAALGEIVFFNTLATFITRRCYDQIVNLCKHNRPVRLVGNGGGLVYSRLGHTHLAIEDIAIMRALPNMTVVAPCDAEEMVRVVEASIDWPGPMYIRMARGGEPVISWRGAGFKIGKAILMRRAVDLGHIAFMATGAMTDACLAVVRILQDLDESDCSVTHFHTVKPLDADAVLAHSYGANLIVTVEEGIMAGGFGSAVADVILEHTDDHPHILRLGIPDSFPEGYGTREDLLEQCGLMPAQIASAVRAALG